MGMTVMSSTSLHLPLAPAALETTPLAVTVGDPSVIITTLVALADSGRCTVFVLGYHSLGRNIGTNNTISVSCRREGRQGGNEEGCIQNHGLRLQVDQYRSRSRMAIVSKCADTIVLRSVCLRRQKMAAPAIMNVEMYA